MHLERKSQKTNEINLKAKKLDIDFDSIKESVDPSEYDDIKLKPPAHTFEKKAIPTISEKFKKAKGISSTDFE